MATAHFRQKTVCVFLSIAKFHESRCPRIAATTPKVVGGHPHRFRDTFAVSLLNGVELPHVSILLGHASVKIAERRYAPWMKARQEQLEAEVKKKMWAQAVECPPGSRRRSETCAV